MKYILEFIFTNPIENKLKITMFLFWVYGLGLIASFVGFYASLYSNSVAFVESLYFHSRKVKPLKNISFLVLVGFT